MLKPNGQQCKCVAIIVAFMELITLIEDDYYFKKDMCTIEKVSLQRVLEGDHS